MGLDLGYKDTTGQTPTPSTISPLYNRRWGVAEKMAMTLGAH